MLALVQGFSPLGRGKSHTIEHETKRGKKKYFCLGGSAKERDNKVWVCR